MSTIPPVPKPDQPAPEINPQLTESDEVLGDSVFLTQKLKDMQLLGKLLVATTPEYVSCVACDEGGQCPVSDRKKSTTCPHCHGHLNANPPATCPNCGLTGGLVKIVAELTKQLAYHRHTDEVSLSLDKTLVEDILKELCRNKP